VAGVRDVLRTVIDAADARTPGWVYGAVSVDTDRERARMRRAGLAFVDPEGAPARAADVEATAAGIVARSARAAAAWGLVAASGGALSLLPETVAWATNVLRLGQRLAVVYGFDLDTPRGEAAVARAIAAGFQVELPRGGLVGARASTLFRAPSPVAARARLARAAVSQAVRVATGRLARLVPGLAGPVAARADHAELVAAGGRMQGVLRALAEAPGPDPEQVVDAVEVGRGAR
jgi:hypothetical protein